MAFRDDEFFNLVLDKAKEAPRDGLIYLVGPIDDKSAFFASDGQLLYAARAAEEQNKERIETQLMSLHTGVNIAPVACESHYPKGDYNIISLETLTDPRIAKAFLTICAAYSETVESHSFIDFFFSLENLFKPNTEQCYKNAVGLFGELTFINSMWDSLKIDASASWQLSGVNSKLDFVFDDFNVEVKTTTKDEDIVLIKHQQLFNSAKNYLFFVKISTDPSGQSLQELSAMLKACGCFSTLRSRIVLERELLRIEPKNIKEKYSVISSNLYHSSDLNVFKEVDERVSRLSYCLNIAGISTTSLENVYNNSNN